MKANLDRKKLNRVWKITKRALGRIEKGQALDAEANFRLINEVLSLTDNEANDLVSSMFDCVIKVTKAKVSYSDLFSANKDTDVIYVKYLVMWGLHNIFGMKALKIGKIFGTTHSSVLYAKSEIKAAAKIYKRRAEDLEQIKKLCDERRGTA